MPGPLVVYLQHDDRHSPRETSGNRAWGNFFFFFFRPLVISRHPHRLLECALLHTLDLHGNPVTLDAISANDGWEALEKRRRARVDKQIAGNVLLSREGALDDGIDRL